MGGVNVGVAPAANIYGVKVLFDDLRGTSSVILAGVEFVISQRQKNASRPIVVQMSLGRKCDSSCASFPLVRRTSH